MCLSDKQFALRASIILALWGVLYFHEVNFKWLCPLRVFWVSGMLKELPSPPAQLHFKSHRAAAIGCQHGQQQQGCGTEEAGVIGKQSFKQPWIRKNRYTRTNRDKVYMLTHTFFNDNISRWYKDQWIQYRSVRLQIWNLRHYIGRHPHNMKQWANAQFQRWPLLCLLWKMRIIIPAPSTWSGHLEIRHTSI